MCAHSNKPMSLRGYTNTPELPHIEYEITFPKPKTQPHDYPQTAKTLGDIIKRRRQNRKLQQSELGELLGVTSCTIANWEKNRRLPTLPYRPLLDKFLGKDKGFCNTFDIGYPLSPETFGEKLVVNTGTEANKVWLNNGSGTFSDIGKLKIGCRRIFI